MKCRTTNVSAHYICLAEVSHDQLTISTAQASLAIFNRTLAMVDIASGEKKVTAKLGSTGPKSATHTNSYWPLPSKHLKQYTSSLVKHYHTVDNEPPASSLAA